MTADTDPNQVTIQVKNPQDAVVIHWFIQQKTLLERMLGCTISSINLTYSDADGVGLNYLKAPAAQTSQQATGGAPAPQ